MTKAADFSALSSINLFSLLNQSDMGVVIHKWEDASIVYVNPAALTMLGVSSEQIFDESIAKPDWNFIDQRNRRINEDEYPVYKVRRFQVGIKNEILGIVKAGQTEIVWVSVSAYPELHDDKDQSSGFIVVFFHEITQYKHAIPFESVVENAMDIIIITEAADIDAPSGPRIVYVNKAFEKLTGYSASEVVDETPRILQGSLTSKEACLRIRQALEKAEPVREQLLNYGKDGKPYWLDISIVPLRNSFGELTHFAAIERDISYEKFHSDQLEQRNKDLQLLKSNLTNLVDQRTKELRNLNRELELYAYSDCLTGITNRRGFELSAMKLLGHAHRHSSPVCVGIMDIDFFKTINDTYGHEAGDQSLKTLGEVMLRFFRQQDCFARIGGEEFAFCLLLADEKRAFDIIERLRIKVEQQPIVFNNTSFNITVSAGLYTFNCADTSLEQALAKADEALYQAKESGRNKVVVYANAT